MADEKPLRLLVVAYEFPPSPSPQSLRWSYLTRELVALGHDVHVLAPDHPADGLGLPAIPPGLTVHRCFAGPLMGFLAARARRRRRSAGLPAEPQRQGGAAVAAEVELNWKGRLWHAGLNWKGRMFVRAQRLMEWLLFPDLRGEWKPWAKRRLVALLDEIRPDVVISSHEPATTLELGLMAARRGVRWVADLGDPVLAPYTPRRWHRRAEALEREVCARAECVLVTTDRAAALLARRHGLPADRCAVLTQGYDPAPALPPDGPQDPRFDTGRLELLYTGSFYGFRRHDALMEAVLATPGTRLNIASVKVPDDIAEVARRSPGAIRLLGFMPHLRALKAQRAVDVLVNIANDDPCQVPGKLYEYLGARKPILHLCPDPADPADAAAALLAGTGHGVACRNDARGIARVLRAWRDLKQAGGTVPFVPTPDAAAGHAWPAIAARLDAIIRARHRPEAGSERTPFPTDRTEEPSR